MCIVMLNLNERNMKLLRNFLRNRHGIVERMRITDNQLGCSLQQTAHPVNRLAQRLHCPDICHIPDKRRCIQQTAFGDTECVF